MFIFLLNPLHLYIEEFDKVLVMLSSLYLKHKYII